MKLEVQLPKGTPFLYVSSKPIPGWTVKMTEAPLPEPVESEGTKITKAISTVTWTASEAAAVKPGEYQDFSISAGPLPKPGTIELPAIQTYSDGEVVRWNQPTPASGEEPEYPTPTFVITAAEPSSSILRGSKRRSIRYPPVAVECETITRRAGPSRAS